MEALFALIILITYIIGIGVHDALEDRKEYEIYLLETLSVDDKVKGRYGVEFIVVSKSMRENLIGLRDAKSNKEPFYGSSEELYDKGYRKLK